MYIPKDLPKKLRKEANLADINECHVWSKIMRQAAYRIMALEAQVFNLNAMIDQDLDAALDRICDYTKTKPFTARYEGPSD